MSMLALPEIECQEILSLFRQHLSHVPDAWLQELASNYGQDAIKDIDPNDVIAILSVPGELHRIQILHAQGESPMDIHRRIHEELIARGIEPRRIIASLLTIQSYSAMMENVGKFIGLIIGDYADIREEGWGWYQTQPKLNSTLVTNRIIVSL